MSCSRPSPLAASQTTSISAKVAATARGGGGEGRGGRGSAVLVPILCSTSTSPRLPPPLDTVRRRGRRWRGGRRECPARTRAAVGTEPDQGRRRDVAHGAGMAPINELAANTSRTLHSHLDDNPSLVGSSCPGKEERRRRRRHPPPSSPPIINVDKNVAPR